MCSAKDFFFGLTSHGSNFWLSPAQVAVYLINNYVLGGGGSNLGYDWVQIKNSDGSKIALDNGNYFGFKARDLFNNFGIGVQGGYQPAYSIFGAWVNAGYKYRQFGMTIPDIKQSSDRYKMNAWYVGVGIRLSPFKSTLENSGWSPFVDFGTSYNSVFKGDTPFGKELEQFGKGFSTTFGVGARFVDDYTENGFCVSIAFTLPQYNYFNQDFETRAGVQPFEHVKAKNYAIQLRIQTEF